MNGHHQTVVRLVPIEDAQRYATEFAHQPQLVEPVDNRAAPCAYPNTALARAALAETVVMCPRCRHPTNRLIAYPGSDQLGPCRAYPYEMPEEDQKALSELRRTGR